MGEGPRRGVGDTPVPRILLINDTADHDNWGSNACAEALRRILAAEVPGAELDPLPSRWIGRKYTWDPFVGGRRLLNQDSFLHRLLLKPQVRLPNVADAFEALAADWQAGRGGPGASEVLPRLAAADAVVFNAEGSTYRNNYTCMKSLFLLWLARSVFGKPAFFLNGSVTLTDVDPILPGVLRKVFPALDGVTVREPNSLRMVERYVPGVRAELAPDSVFAFGPDEAAAGRGEAQRIRAQLGGKPYFCFSLSMLPMDFSRRDSAGREALQRLREVVPQAVLMARDHGDQFLRDVASEAGAVFMGPNATFRDVMGVLAGASFLFSGRYHHIIMGAIVGCPSIALTSTSPKVEGLCELLGADLVHAPFDPTWMTPEINTIVGEARRILERGPSLRDACSARAAALRPQTARMGTLVRQRLA